jgi:2'-5' RNA ligase/GNAT superfamily N-acetyltransferase
MRMDLGGGRIADVPEGASHRSLIKVTGPDGVHELSWGGLQGLSNGELPARRTPKTADYHLQHRAPDEESGKPLHHYEGGDGEDHIDIYRAVPHDVRHIEHDSWITTNPEYAHQHAQQYDGSPAWPVLHASVPKKHLFWDENDPNEHGYQGPDIPEADVHHEEHGVISRDDYDEEHPQPSAEERERGEEHFHGTAVHLPPRAHEIVHNPKKPKDVRARVLLGHLPKEIQHNSGGPWEEDADDAELESMDQADSMGPHPEHGTPPTQVVVHGSQWGDKPHGISWADSSKEPLVFHRDYAHHTFGGKTAVVNSVERWDSPSLEFKTRSGKRSGRSHTTITAHDKGDKVGHVRMTEGGTEVDDLHVHPKRRGEGIGHALMDQAIDQFGHNTLRLHASPTGSGGPGREALMSFYSSHGFEPEPGRGEGYMIRHPLSAEALRRTAVDAAGSMMVALVPPQHVIDHLVQEDGEKPEELHITLLYLGKESKFTPKQVSQLPMLVSQWAKGQSRMKATTQGAGTFVNDGSHVLWASVNIPEVTRAHDGLVDFLRGHGLPIEEDYGYIPHITLKYDKYHVRFLPKVEPMTWDVTQVWFCRGEEWTPYALGR